uniref:Uncharacterized protein n=1 Tax=Physcomitrium patens TaxID=3218 RepID=A0A2K1IYL2_PHYPA|nr:hypothetical protein PHYPA_024186 [Physcomitrium patens]
MKKTEFITDFVIDVKLRSIRGCLTIHSKEQKRMADNWITPVSCIGSACCDQVATQYLYVNEARACSLAC